MRRSGPHLPDVDYARMIQALNSVHYAGETGFYRSAALRACEEALLDRLQPGARVLDVACGAARVTAPTAAREVVTVGLDINLAALQAARSAHRSLPLVQANMASLPVADESFEHVWCLRFSFNALATETERLRTISELWRVCAPGGTVVVEAFNWYFPGRFGLLRLASLLDLASRRLRWHGQGRAGSVPLPARDILYLANKARGAAPGYAHLTTVRELRRLTEAAGLKNHAQLSDEAGIASGTTSPVRTRHHGYATWLTLHKPATTADTGVGR